MNKTSGSGLMRVQGSVLNPLKYIGIGIQPPAAESPKDSPPRSHGLLRLRHADFCACEFPIKITGLDINLNFDHKLVVLRNHNLTI